jgi:hypothetical protein
MKVVAWKAWYRGDLAFCSTGYEWEDLPDEGVVGVVIVFDDATRRNMTGSDFYWMATILGQPTLCQGLHDDNPAERYPGASIKKGVWTTDDEMRRVLGKMGEFRG